MSRIAKGLVFTSVAAAAMAGTAGIAAADSDAHGAATNSPGVLSGNLVQVPVHVPINLCGNTVNVIALLNPAFGNECAND
ncbi:chaplin [Streptomyces sp. NPDC059517]|uniref:chaplin n=1 Tax=unclassified Streptomyces TaxID=2593676 RepID=UPI00363C4231